MGIGSLVVATTCGIGSPLCCSSTGISSMDECVSEEGAAGRAVASAVSATGRSGCADSMCSRGAGVLGGDDAVGSAAISVEWSIGSTRRDAGPGEPIPSHAHKTAPAAPRVHDNHRDPRIFASLSDHPLSSKTGAALGPIVHSMTNRTVEWGASMPQYARTVVEERPSRTVGAKQRRLHAIARSKSVGCIHTSAVPNCS